MIGFLGSFGRFRVIAAQQQKTCDHAYEQSDLFPGYHVSHHSRREHGAFWMPQRCMSSSDY